MPDSINTLNNYDNFFDCISADPSFISGCFLDYQCSGETIIGLGATGSEEIERRECCVNTEALSYTVSDQCFDCIGMFRLL